MAFENLKSIESTENEGFFKEIKKIETEIKNKAVENFNKKAEDPKFRAEVMNTLRILRTINENLNKETKMTEKRQIIEKYAKQLGEDYSTRMQKVVDVTFMLEQRGNSFTEEFNEKPMTREERSKIKNIIGE